MSGETVIKPSWSTYLEIFPSPKSQRFEHELGENDARLGKIAETLYGTSPDDKPRLLFRVYRKLRFEYQKMSDKFFEPSGRVLWKLFWPLVVRFERRSYKKLHSFDNRLLFFNSESDLDKNALISFIEGNDFTHLVVVRNLGKTLWRTKKAIVRALAQQTSPIIYFNSFARDGSKVQRPTFSSELFTKVDYLGPLIVIERQWLDKHLLRDWTTWKELLSYASSWDFSLSTKIASLDFHPLEPEVETSKLSNNQYSPLISIIIPTCGSRSNATKDDDSFYIVDAIISIIKKTTYPTFEILVVADDETPPAVIFALQKIPDSNIKIIRWSLPFNFSSKINRGASIARGKYLLFLNDDVEIINSIWLESMYRNLTKIKNTGMVGSLLFFEDGTIQHAGHVYNGGPSHIGIGKPLVSTNSNFIDAITREVSGVTAACALIERNFFREIGGMSPIFPNNYNDVDLSLKVQLAGKKIILDSESRLYHFESKSRNPSIQAFEIKNLNRRWRKMLIRDKYFPD